ncbi:MAG: hypothetical protein KDC80_24945 [Saprospiraceae bacterium]|nr:hypothetical protein [Saprospiraceae bacterium]
MPPEIGKICSEFKKEAKRRNISMPFPAAFWSFDFESIEGLKAGKCEDKILWKEISVDPGKWKRLDSIQRRALLFHEWGHGILGRKHRNAKFPSGECISMMDGEEGDFFCSNNFYSERWWNYYLDELFDSTVLIPEWYHSNKIDLSTYGDKRELIYTCSLRENLDIKRDSTLLLAIDLEGDLDWKTNAGFRLQIDSMGFWVDTKEGRIIIEKYPQMISSLDAYYFVLQDAEETFPDLREIDVLIEDRWIYFYLNKIQIHLMEYHAQELLISSSTPSPFGSWFVYR